MSIFQDIQAIKSSRKNLYEFGLVMGIFFGLLAGLLLWKGKPAYWIFAALSVFFFVFTLAAPMALKPVQKVWMTLAVLMGFVMTRVILTFLFFVVLTPVSLLSRLFGNKFLDIQFKKDLPTYWIYRPKEQTQRNYEAQF